MSTASCYTTFWFSRTWRAGEPLYQILDKICLCFCNGHGLLVFHERGKRQA